MGKGLVYYVGGYCPDSAVAKLAQTLHAPIVHASSEVEVVARQDDHARYLGLINHGRSAQRVTGLGSAKELISDTPVPEEGLVLSSFGVAVIQQGLKD